MPLIRRLLGVLFAFLWLRATWSSRYTGALSSALELAAEGTGQCAADSAELVLAWRQDTGLLKTYTPEGFVDAVKLRAPSRLAMQDFVAGLVRYLGWLASCDSVFHIRDSFPPASTVIHLVTDTLAALAQLSCRLPLADQNDWQFATARACGGQGGLRCLFDLSELNRTAERDVSDPWLRYARHAQQHTLPHVVFAAMLEALTKPSARTLAFIAQRRKSLNEHLAPECARRPVISMHARAADRCSELQALDPFDSEALRQRFDEANMYGSLCFDASVYMRLLNRMRDVYGACSVRCP